MIRYFIFNSILVSLLLGVNTCNASCYFSIEYQGSFVMQSSVNPGSQVQYSHVNITADSIPIWGHCHLRIGNNVILMDNTANTNCIRCFHLKLRSKNVLHVHTEGLDKCYTNEDAARQTCPDEYSLQQQSFSSKEIILYRTEVQKEYCPINGRFTYVYDVNDGLENKKECPDSISELDNCPLASELNLRFRECSFYNHDITFKCLGHWSGPSNQNYLALLDTRVGDRQPQYRCAMFREDAATRNIYMAFSSDSTCTSNLHSATVGYETLTLTPVPTSLWPQRPETISCRFPSWLQGEWQQVYVEENTFTYKDYSSLKTYSMHCLDSNMNVKDRFPVFGHSQCGEELYTCLWVKRRGVNVFEFQMGLQRSTGSNDSLCADKNFLDNQWITQGRMERLQESPCPIAGEYTGYIPDGVGLCAKLSSDCRLPEIMFYSVSDCAVKETYEERQYRCLGQWEENGRVYTYTQRRDVGSYECFVGTIISDQEIYIKEAGEHCERDVDPLQNGMKLTKHGPCIGNQVSTAKPARPNTTVSRMTTKHVTVPEPTKPWKPITAPPRSVNIGNTAQNITARVNIVFLLCCLMNIFYFLSHFKL